MPPDANTNIPTTASNDNRLISRDPGPKRNLGRSARRRRKKLLEIQKAEEQLLLNDQPQDLNIKTTIMPTDRDKIWPGVQERSSLSEEDAPLLMAQLGYIPGNAIKVAARQSDIPALKKYFPQTPQNNNNDKDKNMPVVLKLYPIAVRDVHAGGKSGNRKFKSRKRKLAQKAGDLAETNGNHRCENDKTEDGQPQKEKIDPSDDDDNLVVEPFPTLYWLTDPLLRTLVSKLELNSMGVTLGKRLGTEPDALASMTKANQAYGQERYNLLTPQDIAFIEKRKWEKAFSPDRGVAGIKNYASVKCLHSHVAHFLSGGQGSSDNIIGKWVMEEIAQMLAKHSEEEKLNPEVETAAAHY